MSAPQDDLEVDLQDERRRNERRRNDTLVLELMQQIKTGVSATRAELRDHIIKEPKEVAEAISVAMSAAFPEGDVIGHRMYHASVIERNRWVIGVCKEIAKEIAKYGLIGFLVWLGYHAWVAFLHGPAK